ncbi:MAG: hypothetical protein C0436_00005 [Alphaproteobacteria bacterium]|nr:hypothetical protein [Alphaproteobacteria bacterium]
MSTHHYVDWSKVPQGFDWVAVDSPKETAMRTEHIKTWPNLQGVGAYTKKPVKKFDSFWNSDTGGNILVNSDAITGPIPENWEKSLIKRPN